MKKEQALVFFFCSDEAAFSFNIIVAGQTSV